MENKNISDLKTVEGSVFIDNLMMSSADRLLNTNYSHLKNDPIFGGMDNENINIELNNEIATGLITHDLSNLAILLESIICHDVLYINADFINIWNKDIHKNLLKTVSDLVIPIEWPIEERTSAEKALYDIVSKSEIGIVQDEYFRDLLKTVFRASHCVYPTANLKPIASKLCLPRDVVSPLGTPFYIAVGLHFYLMCSQEIGVPFKPSSARSYILSEYIKNKVENQAINAAEMSIKILEKGREAVANEYLERLLEFNYIEAQFPCILAAILNDANSSKDILPITIQIRNSKEAKAFRTWANEFTKIIQSGDLSKIGKYIKEIERVIENVNKLLGLSKEDNVGINFGWGPANLSKNFSLPTILNKPIYFKRHLWFLHNIYSKVVKIARTSESINKIFINNLPSWFPRFQL